MNGLTEKEFNRRLVMYLDGALAPEESRNFLDAIMESPEQLAKLEQEKSFREFLRKKVGRRNVSSALVQSIKTKISDPSTSSYWSYLLLYRGSISPEIWSHPLQQFPYYKKETSLRPSLFFILLLDHQLRNRQKSLAR